MLSYALAIAVAISSLVLFSTAFLMSKIHRKDDFLWSAVGLFYALILWYCARNITGAVLLGQTAATILVVAYSWQTIKLRRAIANPAQASETNDFSVVRSINSLLKRRKPQVQAPTKPVTKAPAPKVTEQNIAIPETPAEISEQSDRETPAAQDTAQENIKDTNVADAKPLVEIIDKTTSDIPNIQDNSGDRHDRASKPVKTEPDPLPNKLPEVAQEVAQEVVQGDETKSTEKEVATKEDTASEPIQENIQPELDTEDLSQEISNEAQDEIPAPEVEPTSKTVPTETAKDVNPKSSLDSLETVEVAEVLEAESARQSNNRETDRFNIIEVTTTEVNVTKEVIKRDDRDRDSDGDFEDLKN